ncbi:M14 family metallocarboxypeptidase [Silanimonas sp.]|uniref:M14 family metallopeptidase n=1 Tax=Silanimonas sp. TaxID=1929290 RepID=UPI001BC31B2C|nr:M14 family metallocarboxypeptidase [Silanimonas sp.]MBS3896325.1 M14 family metallocarboxypeptidase [Silanimonas sp.]MBS3923754.1 M14 family metallocarboxypeptidase [Xanthomonadaceae bacterium]
MTLFTPYPIGTPGQPWGEAERTEWRSRQPVQRRYADEVLPRIDALRDRFEVIEYGRITVDAEVYPLLALRSRDRNDALPTVLVTGGVHGYETSGVHGALAFLERHGDEYAGCANLLVAPCISPWAYERVQRWNAAAIDPNRMFREGSPCAESAALLALLAPLASIIRLHIDLHETTDSDENEFRPALAARDGKAFEPGEIPDGFYLVADALNPQLDFQCRIIEAVAKVTHIAPADAKGRIIGAEVVAPGVILYPFRSLGLCAGLTDALYTTTTEVYPDSPRTTPAACVDAQVAAVRAAIDFVLAA